MKIKVFPKFHCHRVMIKAKKVMMQSLAWTSAPQMTTEPPKYYMDLANIFVNSYV